MAFNSNFVIGVKVDELKQIQDLALALKNIRTLAGGKDLSATITVKTGSVDRATKKLKDAVRETSKKVGQDVVKNVKVKFDSKGIINALNRLNTNLKFLTDPFKRQQVAIDTSTRKVRKLKEEIKQLNALKRTGTFAAGAVDPVTGGKVGGRRATEAQRAAGLDRLEEAEEERNKLLAKRRGQNVRRKVGPFSGVGGAVTGGAIDPSIGIAINNLGTTLGSAIKDLGRVLERQGGKGKGGAGGASQFTVTNAGETVFERLGVQKTVKKLLGPLASGTVGKDSSASLKRAQQLRINEIAAKIATSGHLVGLSKEDIDAAAKLRDQTAKPRKGSKAAPRQQAEATKLANAFVTGRGDAPTGPNVQRATINFDHITDLVDKISNLPKTMEKALTGAVSKAGDRGKQKGISRIFSVDQVQEVINKINELSGMGKLLSPLNVAFMDMAVHAEKIANALRLVKISGLRIVGGGPVGVGGAAGSPITFAPSTGTGGAKNAITSNLNLRTKEQLAVKPASKAALKDTLRSVFKAQQTLQTAEDSGKEGKIITAAGKVAETQRSAFSELNRLMSAGRLGDSDIAKQITSGINTAQGIQSKITGIETTAGAVKVAEDAKFDKRAKGIDANEKAGLRKADKAFADSGEEKSINAAFDRRRQIAFDANEKARTANANASSKVIKDQGILERAEKSRFVRDRERVPRLREQVTESKRLSRVAQKKFDKTTSAIPSLQTDQDAVLAAAEEKGRIPVRKTATDERERLATDRAAATRKADAVEVENVKTVAKLTTARANLVAKVVSLAQNLDILSSKETKAAKAAKLTTVELKKEERQLLATGANAKRLAEVQALLKPIRTKELRTRQEKEGQIRSDAIRNENLARAQNARDKRVTLPFQRITLPQELRTPFSSVEEGVKQISSALKGVTSANTRLLRANITNQQPKIATAGRGLETARNTAINQLLTGSESGIPGIGPDTFIGGKLQALQGIDTKLQATRAEKGPTTPERTARIAALQKQMNGLSSAILRAANAQSRFGAAAANSDTILSKFGKRVRSLSFFLGAGFILFGAVARIRAYAREVVQLEESFARIQGIVAGRSLDDRLQIQKGTISIAKEFGANLQEVVKTSQIFVQTGIGVRKSLEATRSAIAASIGGGVPISQARETAIAVERISGGRVSGEDIATRIARTESQRAVVGTDLSVAIQRLGAFATQLEPDILGSIDAFDAVIGLVTTIVETTRVTGNQAATALKFILARLSRPEVSKKLEQDFGIALGGGPVGAERRPLIDILEDVSREFQDLNKAGKGRRAGELAVALAGGRQIGPAIALLQNFERALEIASASSLALGDIQERTALSMDTAGAKFRQAGVAIFEFVQAFVTDSGLLDTAVAFAGLLGGFAKSLAKDPQGAAIAATKAAGLGGLGIIAVASAGQAALGVVQRGGANFLEKRGVLAGVREFKNAPRGFQGNALGSVTRRGLSRAAGAAGVRGIGLVSGFGRNLATGLGFLASTLGPILATLATLAAGFIAVSFIYQTFFKETRKLDAELAKVRESFRFVPLTREQVEATSISKQFRTTGAELGLGQAGLTAILAAAAKLVLEQTDRKFKKKISTGEEFDTGAFNFIQKQVVAALDNALPTFVNLGTQDERIALASRLLKEAVQLNTEQTRRLTEGLQRNTDTIIQELLADAEDNVLATVPTIKDIQEVLVGAPVTREGRTRFQVAEFGFGLTKAAIQAQKLKFSSIGLGEADEAAITEAAIKKAIPDFSDALLTLPGLVTELGKTINDKNISLGQAIDAFILTINKPKEQLEGTALERRELFDANIREIVKGAIGLTANEKQLLASTGDTQISGAGALISFAAKTVKEQGAFLLTDLQARIDASSPAIVELKRILAATETSKNRLAGFKPSLDNARARGLVADRLLAALIKFDVAIEKLSQSIDFQSRSQRDIDPRGIRLRAVGTLFDDIGTLRSNLENDLRKTLTKQIQEDKLAAIEASALGLLSAEGRVIDFDPASEARFEALIGTLGLTATTSSQAIKDQVSLLRSALKVLTRDTGLLNQFAGEDFTSVLNNLAIELDVENVGDIIRLLPNIPVMLRILAELEGSIRKQTAQSLRQLSIVKTNDDFVAAVIKASNQLADFREDQGVRLTEAGVGPISAVGPRIANIQAQQSRKILEQVRLAEVAAQRLLDELVAAGKPETSIARQKRELDLANKVINIKRIGELETQRLVIEAAEKARTDIQADTLKAVNSSIVSASAGLKSVLGGFRVAFPKGQTTGQFFARIIDPIAKTLGENAAQGFIDALVGEGGLFRNQAQALFKASLKVEETRKLAILESGIIKRGHIDGVREAFEGVGTFGVGIFEPAARSAMVFGTALERATVAVSGFTARMISGDTDLKIRDDLGTIPSQREFGVSGTRLFLEVGKMVRDANEAFKRSLISELSVLGTHSDPTLFLEIGKMVTEANAVADGALEEIVVRSNFVSPTAKIISGKGVGIRTPLGSLPEQRPIKSSALEEIVVRSSFTAPIAKVIADTVESTLAIRTRSKGQLLAGRFDTELPDIIVKSSQLPDITFSSGFSAPIAKVIANTVESTLATSNNLGVLPTPGKLGAELPDIIAKSSQLPDITTRIGDAAFAAPIAKVIADTVESVLAIRTRASGRLLAGRFDTELPDIIVKSSQLPDITTRIGDAAFAVPIAKVIADTVESVLAISNNLGVLPTPGKLGAELPDIIVKSSQLPDITFSSGFSVPIAKIISDTVESTLAIRSQTGNLPIPGEFGAVENNQRLFLEVGQMVTAAKTALTTSLNDLAQLGTHSQQIFFDVGTMVTNANNALTTSLNTGQTLFFEIGAMVTAAKATLGVTLAELAILGTHGDPKLRELATLGAHGDEDPIAEIMAFFEARMAELAELGTHVSAGPADRISDVSLALSRQQPLTPRPRLKLEGEDSFPAPDELSALGPNAEITALGDASVVASSQVLQFALAAGVAASLISQGTIPGFGDASVEIGETKDDIRKKAAIKALKEQAAIIASQFVGTALGNAIGGKGKDSFANEGSSIGGGIGAAVGSIFPGGTIIGGVAGSIIGGIVGGFFGRGEPEPPKQVAALQRIELNTRETVTAIENQTELLSLDKRLLNVPSSFQIPAFRPLQAGGGSTAALVGPISIVINDARDPDAVAIAVRRELQGSLRRQGSFVSVRV